jgi:DNA (cytosine-5)-methyltransferase 1
MARIWSFFTGAGGLDLGMESVGLKPELAVEIDPTCCATLATNHSNLRVLRNDVTQLGQRDLRQAGGSDDVDLMVGGPPCQSFSTGGGRAALNDPRGNLIFEYLRIIDEIRPRAFVLENVANLITAAINHRPINKRPGNRWNLSSYSVNNEPSSGPLGKGEPAPLGPDELSGSAIAYLLDVLKEKLEYSISLAILNAADFGAPQRRLRLLIVGSRDAKAPAFPSPTHGPGAPVPYATVRDAIWDLRGNPGPGSAYTDGVRTVFDLVPEGRNWRSLPPEIARSAMGERSYVAGGGKMGFFRRLAWDEPSPTITGRSNRKGSALCHPVESRPLSVHECARLQGFPDGWHFAGSAAARYQQVGNAVPVALGGAVGRMMTQHLDGSGDVETRTVDAMLSEATTRLRSSALTKSALTKKANVAIG